MILFKILWSVDALAALVALYFSCGLARWYCLIPQYWYMDDDGWYLREFIGQHLVEKPAI